jgi:hypothetical protein
MPRILALIALLLTLSACQTNAAGGDANNLVVDDNAIQWDRSPSTVVFRAEVTGGSSEGSFATRNQVPPCTVYGDNRVVWLNQIGSYETQVLFDQVPDQTIRDFVTALTISERFFDYTAQADLQPATTISPVIETLTLFVSGQERQSDSFSGWDGDYYARILAKCQTISTTPVLFEPTAAWISAEAIPADQTDSSAINIPWDAAANGLSFAEVAESGERRWITDRNVAVIWNLIRNSNYNLRFTESETQYYVALEVPNVTRNAPPAPAAQ